MNKGYDHERLLSYIEDELPGEQRREFERTIAADARLARLIEQMQRDRAMLRRLPPAEPPGELMEAVEHRLERDMLFGDGEAVDEEEAETNDEAVVVSAGSARAAIRVWRWSAVAAMLIVGATVGVVVIAQFGENSPTGLNGQLAMRRQRSQAMPADQPIADVGRPGGEQSMARRAANDEAATIPEDASGAGIEAETINEADTASAIEKTASVEASHPAVADAASGDADASQMSMTDESADRVDALAMRTADVPAEAARLIGGAAPPMQAAGKNQQHESGIGRERIESPPTVTIDVTSDNLDEAVAALGRFIGRLALDVSGRGRGGGLTAAREHELKLVQRPALLSLDATEITPPARQVKVQPAASGHQPAGGLARHVEAAIGDRAAEHTYVIDLRPATVAAMMSDRNWPHTPAATNITTDNRRDDRNRVAPPPADKAVSPAPAMPAPATPGPALKDEIKPTKTMPVTDWHQIIVGRLVAQGVTPQMVAGQGVRLHLRISPTRPATQPAPGRPPNPAPPPP